MKRKILGVAGGVLLLLALGGPAMAQDTTIESLAYDLDVVWVGLAAALVFFMQAGFALVETGFTRAKNSANIGAKNLADMAIGGVAYWAIGGALAYGATSGGLLGTSGFFFEPGAESSVLGGDGVQFIFQLVFAATAATIVSGAVAERMNFVGYLVISLAITGFIYPIVSHWQWGGGWLSEMGYYDFAGSSIVHLTGGVAALVGAAMLGPRIGRYNADGSKNPIPGHSVPLGLIGVFVLWLGWFGFNGGSTLAANGQGAVIGHVLFTTVLAGATGGVLAFATVWITSGKPDPIMAGNGVLAGLVGITAGPDLAGSVGAFVVGAICGVVVVASTLFFERVRVDDPVGAISVHGTCGIIGTLAVGFYAAGREAGFSLGTQAIGVVAIIGFVGIVTAALFFVVDKIFGLRVSSQIELEGLDWHEHGVEGYADDIPVVARMLADRKEEADAASVGASDPSVLNA
ncbi:ammonium transporter [Salsipaludibacter albus]|uniref:ammonium transporter n=1 Tax=Salsipaludibacter albus TaxID=2849650 RepID=UPI001EE42E66|nr:ammonium transporter [Salsipaludibacter albus]MBY5162998.1 ammonium transporter [Salsipaludibacter albus]